MKIDEFDIGMTELFLLSFIFVILKILHMITWSWWWVLSPLWIPIVIGIFIAFIIFIIYSISYCIDKFIY